MEYETHDRGVIGRIGKDAEIEGFKVKYLSSHQIQWNPDHPDYKGIIAYTKSGTAVLNYTEGHLKREPTKITLENIDMQTDKLNLLEKILIRQT